MFAHVHTAKGSAEDHQDQVCFSFYKVWCVSCDGQNLLLFYSSICLVASIDISCSSLLTRSYSIFMPSVKVFCKVNYCLG